MNFTIKKKKPVVQSSVGGFESWPLPVPSSSSATNQPVGENNTTTDYMDAVFTEELEDQDLQEKAEQWSKEGSDLAEQGQLEQALSLWQKTLLICPSHYKVHEMKAQVYLLLEDALLALQSAEIAVKLAPDWIIGLHTLARCQREVGEFYLAVETYERIIELDKEQTVSEEATVELEEVRTLVRQLEERQAVWQQKLQCAGTAEDQEVFRCKYHLALRAKASKDL